MNDADTALVARAEQLDAMRLLRDNERIAIGRRTEGATFKEIGQALGGLTSNRGWQVYNASMRKLRHLVATLEQRVSA